MSTTATATDTFCVQAITMTHKLQRVGNQNLPTESRGREHRARGLLMLAVLEAVSARLQDWASWPVVEEVLRQPPAEGRRTVYVVKFSEKRELILVVEPILSDGSTVCDPDDTDQIELPAPPPPAA